MKNEPKKKKKKKKTIRNPPQVIFEKFPNGTLTSLTVRCSSCNNRCASLSNPSSSRIRLIDRSSASLASFRVRSSVADV
jgi:hypothetical protein